MDPITTIKEWGGWLVGSVVTVLSFRKGHIDERVRVQVDPITSTLTEMRSTLGRIEQKQEEHGEHILDVAQRLARLEGRDDIRVQPPIHQVKR